MKKIIAIYTAALMLAGTNAFAVDQSAVTDIAIGTAKAEVYERIGAPASATADGRREIYSLSNGRKAVLRYFDDILDDGFILIY